jgi:hypothetical protein
MFQPQNTFHVNQHLTQKINSPTRHGKDVQKYFQRIWLLSMGIWTAEFCTK